MPPPQYIALTNSRDAPASQWQPVAHGKACADDAAYDKRFVEWQKAQEEHTRLPEGSAGLAALAVNIYFWGSLWTILHSDYDDFFDDEAFRPTFLFFFLFFSLPVALSVHLGTAAVMASPGAFHHSLWGLGKSVEAVQDELEELRRVPPDISAAIECFHGNSVTTVTGGGTGGTRIVASHLSASGTGSNFAIGGHRRRQQRTIAELPVITFSAVHKFSFENWRDASAPPLAPSEGARRPVLLTLRVRVIYADAATQAAYDAMCRDLHHAHYKDDDSYKFVWRNELAGDRMPAQVLALPSCGSAWLSWPVYLLSVLTLTHGVLHVALDKWVSKRVYFITKEVRAGPGTAF